MCQPSVGAIKMEFFIGFELQFDAANGNLICVSMEKAAPRRVFNATNAILIISFFNIEELTGYFFPILSIKEASSCLSIFTICLSSGYEPERTSSIYSENAATRSR